MALIKLTLRHQIWRQNKTNKKQKIQRFGKDFQRGGAGEGGLSETSALPVASGQDNIQMQFSLKVSGSGPGKLVQ